MTYIITQCKRCCFYRENTKRTWKKNYVDQFVEISHGCTAAYAEIVFVKKPPSRYIVLVRVTYVSLADLHHTRAYSRMMLFGLFPLPIYNFFSLNIIFFNSLPTGMSFVSSDTQRLLERLRITNEQTTPTTTDKISVFGLVESFFFAVDIIYDTFQSPGDDL